MVQLIEVKSDEDYQTAVELFKEYSSDIGIDLEFQNFSQEIATIQNQYSRPEGGIFLIIRDKDTASGCFAIRKFDKTICELKRMYLKKEVRGLGVGKVMLDKAFQFAKELGYQRMRLDTLSTMHSAISLYTKMGFYEIKPYRFNPIEGAKYFEVSL